VISFENKDRSQTEFENGGRNSILVEVTHHEVKKISPRVPDDWTFLNKIWTLKT